jgi:hypothetical protein
VRVDRARDDLRSALGLVLVDHRGPFASPQCRRFARDCCQYCCQAARQRPYGADNSGIRHSAQTATDGSGRCAHSYGSEGYRLGATLGATRMNNLLVRRTRPNNGKQRARHHGLI